MATSGSHSTSRRTAGLLVAAAFALIAAGVVIFIAFASRSGPQSPAVPSNVVDIGKAPDADPNDPSRIQETNTGRVQFADKNDPNRLASELTYDKFTPVGQGYYTLTEPRAWIYLKDGRTLHIRADTGRVKMPNQRAQPESGEFRGKVVVRMYATPETLPGAAPHPINPDTDPPLLQAVTDSVNFDTVVLELQTQDHLVISTKQLLFEGDGLLVRGNQVRERIELLKTKGQFIRYNPTLHENAPKTVAAASTKPKWTSGGSDAGPSAPTPAATTSAAPATLVAPPAPKEVLYHALFSDDVTVTETTRTLTSDTLELFARTLDNKLPEDAFGAFAEKAAATEQKTPAPAATAGTEPAHEARSSAVLVAPAQPFPPLFISAGDHDIVMHWTGPLVLTPILADTTPVELAAGNHFAARFSSDKPGSRPNVSVVDSVNKASAVCATVEYAATTRTLALLTGANAANVTLDAPDSGRVVVPNLKVDLGNGISHVSGPGMISSFRVDAGASLVPAASASADHSAPLDADQSRRITWSDQADFQFRTDGKSGGTMRAELEWASFTGDVLAKDAVSMIGGDFLRAEFMAAGKQPSALKHVRVEGDVVAVSGTRSQPDRALPPLDPYLTADKLDVSFVLSKVDPNQTDPSFALATGSVKAATRDAWLTAGRVETTLGRDEKNALAATEIIATQNARFERADGVTARADTLRVEPVKRTADLTGQIVALARAGSTIIGTQMHLDDATQTLLVHGAGNFEHVQRADETVSLTDPTGAPVTIGAAPAQADPTQTRISAKWTRSMKFDNLAGTVECDGDTEVVAAAPLSTQTARSNRLRLFMTPAGETSPTPATTPGAISPAPNASLAISDDRRLIRAEAIGEIVDREGGTNASVEVRRYSQSPTAGADRVLDQIMFIDGPRILADDVKGTITVPSAGRAIVRDQRSNPVEPVPASAAASPPPLPTSSHGTSRFVWGESMEFTRSTGVLTMRKDVELTHLPLGAAQALHLVAMQLDAKFNIQTKPGNTGQPTSADLVQAEASGAVVAESGTQKLLADRFIYDALNSTAEAMATSGNRVTLYDEKKGPTVAGKLFWDLKNDRIEITEPAPITTIR